MTKYVKAAKSFETDFSDKKRLKNDMKTAYQKWLFMIVRNLELSHFRNYRRFIAELSPGINWIYGANGQAKTNLVEALYYMCNLESDMSLFLRVILWML